jgi:hypothetical protein
MNAIKLNSAYGSYYEVEVSIDSDGDVHFELESSDTYGFFYVKPYELVGALRDLGLLPTAVEKEGGFYGAIAKWLREGEYRGYDVAEIISVEQEERSGGYCETCWYEEIVVEIQYKDSHGDVNSYTYYGNMAELMRELTD